MSENTKNAFNIKYAHFAIVLAFMFLFRFVPPIGTITPYGMAVIGIFIGLIYGWSVDADNLCWTSLLGIVALGVTDFGNAGSALASAFGNESVMLMLLAMFFLGMLQESKLTEWISNKLLGAKFTQGKPWVLTAFIIIAPGLITIFVNAMMVSLIMLVIYEEVFRQAGYKKGDLYPAMVLMGFMMINCICLSLFPFRGWCLMTVGMATKAGVAINMGGWMITAFALVALSCIGWILIMRIMPGCDVRNLREIDISKLMKEDAPLTKRQKAVLAITLTNLIGCIVISFIGGNEGFRLVLKNMGVYGWVLLMIAIAMVWKVDGQPVLDKKKAPAYFYWDTILVTASAMLIATQLTSADAGISSMIGILMTPLFGLPDYVFLLALGVITFVVTNFANNVAVTITMMSVAMTMAPQVGFNLQLALMLITVYGVMGLLTPAGSVYGAMIHAHEFTTPKSSYIAGIVMILFMTLLMALIVIPVGMNLMA